MIPNIRKQLKVNLHLNNQSITLLCNGCFLHINGKKSNKTLVELLDFIKVESQRRSHAHNQFDTAFKRDHEFSLFPFATVNPSRKFNLPGEAAELVDLN